MNKNQYLTFVKMKQIITFILLSIYFTGCSHRDKNLEQSLIEAANSLEFESELLKAKFEIAVAENNTKNNKHNLNVVERFHKSITDFKDDLKKTYYDSIKKTNIDTLIKRYSFLTDTLKKEFTTPYNRAVWRNDTLIIKDFNALKATQHEKVILLEMLNNIFTNELKTARNMLYYRILSSCGFDAVMISTGKIDNENKSNYTFGLTSNQDINKEIRAINIDTILFNGKTIKKAHHLKRNNYFAEIGLDSLNAGNYLLKGTVEEYSRRGDYYYIPFKDTFEIKK